MWRTLVMLGGRLDKTGSGSGLLRRKVTRRRPQPHYALNKEGGPRAPLSAALIGAGAAIEGAPSLDVRIKQLFIGGEEVKLPLVRAPAAHVPAAILLTALQAIALPTSACLTLYRFSAPQRCRLRRQLLC